MDEAFEIATGAELFLARSVYQRDNIYSNMALHYADCSEHEKAINTAKAISTDETRRVALTELASFYARENLLTDNALNVANEIDDDYARCLCLMRVSDVLWKSENKDEALKVLDDAKNIAEGIKHNYQRAIALSEISERYRLKEMTNEADDFLSQAIQLSSDIKDKYEQSILLAHLSTKYDNAAKEIGESEKDVLRKIVVKL